MEEGVSAAKSVHNASVDTLDCENNKFTFTQHASPHRIRLVDCQALVNEQRLSIVEFAQFPSVPYSVISYPWLGVPVDSGFQDHIFHVEGAETADPVGSDALANACAASLLKNTPFLWVDRLCIMQSNRDDKNWQIAHMYQVYKQCQFCIVLAGGLRRLVRLDEPTTWIHRSWTLQEAVAPPQVFVLLDWRLGPGTSIVGGREMSIQEVAPKRSALAPLSLILSACTVGSMEYRRGLGEGETSALLVEASIFSAHPSKHTYNDIPFWRPQRTVIAPNVVALTIIFDEVLSTDLDTRNYAIWQSALMRTSSRPVDMVFSIMGLFGVQLDPSRFEKNDRRAATIALAQAILDAGGTASWLGVGFRVPRDRFASGFPTFPETSVSGVALVSTHTGRQEVSELVDPMYPVGEALQPFPKGQMDNDGYFTFTTRAVEIRRSDSDRSKASDTYSQSLTALDGSMWNIADDEDLTGFELEDVHEDNIPDASPTIIGTQYAALLGWFSPFFPGVTPAHDRNFVRAMLLEEHSEGRFHVVSFFALDLREKANTLRWPEHKFCIGGPNSLTEDVVGHGGSSQSREALTQTYMKRVKPWPRVPRNDVPLVTTEDEAIRKARWAVPQRSLEKHFC